MTAEERERIRKIAPVLDGYAIYDADAPPFSRQREGDQVSGRSMQLLVKIAAAITAAIDARERELVRLVCRRCSQHEDVTARPQLSSHERYDSGMWMHHFRIETCGWSEECPASPLHEAIYQREQRAADGPADA